MRIEIHHYHHIIDDSSDEKVARRLSQITQRLFTSNTALERAIDRAVTDLGDKRQRHPQQETCPMSTGDIEQAFANLEAEATRNEELDASASNVFTQLAALIESSKQDPARIQAIADRLRSSNDALATAIVANTPNTGEGGGNG